MTVSLGLQRDAVGNRSSYFDFDDLDALDEDEPADAEDSPAQPSRPCSPTTLHRSSALRDGLLQRLLDPLFACALTCQQASAAGGVRKAPASAAPPARPRTREMLLQRLLDPLFVCAPLVSKDKSAEANYENKVVSPAKDAACMPKDLSFASTATPAESCRSGGSDFSSQPSLHGSSTRLSAGDASPPPSLAVSSKWRRQRLIDQSQGPLGYALLPRKSEEEEAQAEAWAEQLAEGVAQELPAKELVGLLSGKDFWNNHGVPKAGIPPMRFTDGPFGARGPLFQGPTALLVPCGVAMGATWDPALVADLGVLLGEETKVKGANVLLGPTVNMIRNPIAGRTFECFGEDPWHTTQMAVSYIRGVQAVEGVAACVKHFAANDQEKNRMFCSAEVDEEALRKFHLAPFEAAVKEAKVRCVMTAYNKLNGVYCSEQPWLLKKILRGKWGFGGLVVSDWGGTHSTLPSLNAGLDIEMPGDPNMHYGERLRAMLAKGQVPEAIVRERAAGVLRVMARLGMLPEAPLKAPPVSAPTPSAWTPLALLSEAPPGPTGKEQLPVPRRGLPVESVLAAQPPAPQASPNTHVQQELVKVAAMEATVLLKNDGEVLPLSRRDKIAVIGPNATALTIMGGGSCGVLPNDSKRNLVDQLRACDVRDVTYTRGCDGGQYLPPLGADVLRCPNGRGVLHGTFFDTSAPKARHCFASHGYGKIVEEMTVYNTDSGIFSGVYLVEAPKNMHTTMSWKAVFEGVLTPKETGPFELGLFATGIAEVFLDGTSVLTVPKQGKRMIPLAPTSSLMPEERVVLELEAGQEYEVVIEWSSPKESQTFPAQLQLGGRPRSWKDEEELLQAAESAARASDAAVVVVGTDLWQECEGRDQPSMALPGRAEELIRRVAAANPRTVVCLNVGSPKDLEPWLNSVPAVLVPWFGGQEAAAALAEVLLGDGHGPGGRLPMTWPRQLQDGPCGAMPNERYPGKGSKVDYGESLLVGYRWFQANNLEPAFAFGHGLSYASFEYVGLCMLGGSADSVHAGEHVEVVVTLRNVGKRSGTEVVQLYVSQVAAHSQHALKDCEHSVGKELAAFAKLTLEPGEVADVVLSVPPAALPAPTSGAPTKCALFVGSSSSHTPLEQRISMKSAL